MLYQSLKNVKKNVVIYLPLIQNVNVIIIMDYVILNYLIVNLVINI